MNTGIRGSKEDHPQSQRFFHGTRANLNPGELIEPRRPPDDRDRDTVTATNVYFTRNLDEAIWSAELAVGEQPGRVYVVEPTGQFEEARGPDQKSVGHPTMSCWSREPLRVMGEVTEWPLYHGTRADLKPGDLIKPGLTPNFGKKQRTTNYVYLSRTLDAAVWGAELALGEGTGRIYVVEPTGPIEDDPNLTNKKFRGNPTKSYRSRKPLRVMGEITDWQGHSPQALQAMKDGLKRLEQLGVEPIDD